MMDKRRIRSSSSPFSNRVPMYLLLSFAICLPVALGSGNVRHFQLEGEVGVQDASLPYRVEGPPTNWGGSPPPPFSNPIVTPPGIPNDGFSPTPSPPPPRPPPPSPVPPAPVLSQAPPPVQVSDPPPSPDEGPSSPVNITPPAPFVIILPPRPPSPPLESPAPVWNESEKAGVVIASLAGLIQVIVVTYLLFKRRQMLAMVDEDDDCDNPNSSYGRYSA